MTARRRKHPARPPGRPTSDATPDARDALLDAAGQLYARRGATEVSLRSVALEAGVTPAMIHYYFGGKDGLYDAMLERTFDRVIERVSAVAQRAREDDAPGDARLAELLEVLAHSFAAEPWVAPLFVREVLAEGGRFRERFIERYASRMASLLPQLIGREIEAGRFRADLDPRLAFMSFMGMTIMPFVARPVIERVLGIEYDADFLTRFADHTHQLFRKGVSA